MSTAAPHLLVVDDPVDTILLIEAFAETRVPATIESCRSALDAAERAGCFGRYAGWRRPDLVLVEPFAHWRGGSGLLTRLLAATCDRAVPVIVFSSVVGPDRAQPYLASGVHACLPKPATFAGYEAVVHELVGCLAQAADG